MGQRPRQKQTVVEGEHMFRIHLLSSSVKPIRDPVCWWIRLGRVSTPSYAKALFGIEKWATQTARLGGSQGWGHRGEGSYSKESFMSDTQVSSDMGSGRGRKGELQAWKEPGWFRKAGAQKVILLMEQLLCARLSPCLCGRGSQAGILTLFVPFKLTQDMWWLHEVSVAAVTSSHKLSGLKQDKCIIWRSEVWNRSHWAKIKVSVWLHPPSFLAFPFHEWISFIPWLVAPSNLKASNGWSCLCNTSSSASFSHV